MTLNYSQLQVRDDGEFIVLLRSTQSDLAEYWSSNLANGQPWTSLAIVAPDTHITPNTYWKADMWQIPN